MNTHKIKLFSNITALLIIGAFAAYLAMEWENIPEIVSTHFNISGEADASGGKGSLIILLAVSLLIWGVLAIADCFPNSWNMPVKVTEENRERIVSDGLFMLGILKVLIALLFCYSGVCSVRGSFISWPMYVLLGAVLLDLIIGIVRIIKDR